MVAGAATPAKEAQLVRLQGVPRGLDILQTIPLFSGAAPAPWTFHNSQNVSVGLGAAKTGYPVSGWSPGRYLSLFDGIANAKNFRLYGRLVRK